MRKSSDDLLGIETRIERDLDWQMSLEIRITYWSASLGLGRRTERTSIAPSLNRP